MDRVNILGIIEEYLKDLPFKFTSSGRRRSPGKTTIAMLKAGKVNFTDLGGNMLHVNSSHKYLGSVVEHGCKIEVLRITTEDWRTHERRWFDLHHPESLQGIKEYIKTWTS
jgi:hypothetical protein